MSEAPLFREIQEWIDALLDPGSLSPLTPHLGPPGETPGFGDEIHTGLGRVRGRPIAFYAIDTQVNLGFITSEGSVKIQRVMQKALDLGVPLVALLASPGISIEEGVRSGDEYSKVMMANIELSAQIPQLAVLTAVVMGGSSYSATLMDLIFFNRLRSHLMISGPAVVASAMGEKTTLTELGGSKMHATVTGLAHFVDPTIPAQIERLKWMIEYLPSNCREDPPRAEPRPPRASMPEIPAAANGAFDMNTLIAALADGSEFNEYLPDYGGSMIAAFARIDGWPVGIVANQSLQLGGAIDTQAAHKSGRFIRLCDAYSIPILTLIDVPGYIPGSAEMRKAILREASSMCRSLQTRSPKLSVVVRKCYGAAAFVMLQGRAQKGDLVLALENSRISVMGFEAAKEIVYKNQVPEDRVEEYRQRYFQDYERPEISYRAGIIDQIIPARVLRESLATHLGWLSRKRQNPVSAVRGIEP